MERSLAPYIPTNTDDPLIRKTVSKPTLLMVTLNHEISVFLRKIFGSEFSFIETRQMEEATFLTRFEPIDIAVIGMESKQLSLGNALDLILNLVDQKKHVSIFLYVDSQNRENLQSYLDSGIINHLSTATYPFELLNQLATSFGKKDWTKNLKDSLNNPPRNISDDYPEPNHMEPQVSVQKRGKDITSAPFRGQTPPSIGPLQAVKEQAAINPSPLKKLSLEIAHKIKNPLVSIKTFTELLNQNFDDPYFRKDFYPMVKIEIGKIDQTVETLVDFGEQLHFQTKRVDYYALLKEQVELFNQKGKNPVSIQGTMETLPKISIEESHGRLLHKLLFKIFSDIPGGTDQLKIEIGKIPTDGLEVKWALPFSHRIHPDIQGLEYTMIEWIFENLNGKIETEAGQNGFHIRYVLFPIENTIPAPTALPSRNRRHQQFPIAFLDRRKNERRKQTAPIYFKDRRDFFTKGSEN